MKMVYLPYICVSRERLAIIREELKNLEYPKLLEIPLLNKVLGIRVTEGKEGFRTYVSTDLKELGMVHQRYGAFHLVTFHRRGKYYYVTSLELMDEGII